ncbi:hypothetical protein C8J57DRAFT_1732411 [Mycena rebaudengoi]|nr:hypothetical protein C8J57DRAFT_1732411 [Mycena rebaudengoi]
MSFYRAGATSRGLSMRAGLASRTSLAIRFVLEALLVVELRLLHATSWRAGVLFSRFRGVAHCRVFARVDYSSLRECRFSMLPLPTLAMRVCFGIGLACPVREPPMLLAGVDGVLAVTRPVRAVLLLSSFLSSQSPSPPPILHQ